MVVTHIQGLVTPLLTRAFRSCWDHPGISRYLGADAACSRRPAHTGLVGRFLLWGEPQKDTRIPQYKKWFTLESE